MTKRMTNVEFITDLMERSPYGALAQAFIVQAIDSYASRIAALSVEDCRTMMGKHSLVSPDAWHGVAVDIRDRLAKQYGVPPFDTRSVSGEVSDE